MRPLAALSFALVAAACSQAPSTPVAPPTTTPPPTNPPPTNPPPTQPRDTVTPGSATPVNPGTGMPAWHPTTPLGDPSQNDGHVGRAPRRVNVQQLRASLLTAVGATWRDRRRILSADYVAGAYDEPNADMLDILATTLGQPDYNLFTSETLDPSATFAKLVGDAARKACRDGVDLDLTRPRNMRLLLRYATETDTAAMGEPAIRRNLQYLALRFWARQVPVNDPTLDALFGLFRTASTAGEETSPFNATLRYAPATTTDGWRAVCIALATDPQFLTY